MTNFKLLIISLLAITNVCEIDVFEPKKKSTNNTEIDNHHFQKLNFFGAKEGKTNLLIKNVGLQ